jgi:hypothetical protein
MKLNRELPWNSVIGGLILGLSVIVWTSEVRANVYATNVRIDGGTTNIPAAPGDTITISYLLNEPASLGTTVQIRSGNNVVTNIFCPPESLGTLRGYNEVQWNGLNGSGQNVPGGVYSVSVTPASSGYTNWTQITSDLADLNTYVFDGRGIAVDRNPTSLYYGRIFVANATLGPPPATTPGDTLGILKFNADTSDAEEGISSAGLDGHNWADGSVSPWKIAVSADDYVYVDDLANGGQIFRWDPTISSNSLLSVLRQDNQPAGAGLSGPAIVGTGTNTQIWMVNTNSATVLKWSVTAASICASNDTGLTVVTNAGTNLFAIALDNNGNIYVCAFLTTSGDPSPRVFRYHAYNPASGNGLPETNADWAVGDGDDTYAGASGIAVDPTGTYVAVAFQGPAGNISTNGNTKILWATNGAVAANLDLGVFMQGDNTHFDTDCAWDAVGNVYYIDDNFARWRAVSPPGTNQATTTALATIQMSGAPPPPPSTSLQITRITVVGGNVNIDFSAGTNDVASSFTILGAATVNGTYSDIAGAVITQVGSGLFHATFPIGSNTHYFRISRQGTTPPPSQLEFTKEVISGANIVLTFSGNSTDIASAFTILSAPVVNGSYNAVATATITELSPGVFQASLPTSGPAQFYRVRK